ncbi:hypothetical protein [Microbacterium luticocti]|uniref:hypothetical protein n=1 Tax=Microbacterium luticocti TaxID=451764 RepID=UPI0003FD638C|nr:hypothetical protein [Microbacterium luticocti]
MDSVEQAARRRIVICDGATRYDIAAPVDLTVAAVLGRIGVADGARTLTVRDGEGREVDRGRALRDCADGDILAVVDTSVSPVGPRRSSRDPGAAAGSDAAVWTATGAVALGALALAAVATGLTAPLTTIVAAVFAATAVAGGVVWARRAGTDPASGIAGAFAPLALAFAAGVLAAPSLPWGGAHIAVLCAGAAVAVLAAALAVITADRTAAAALGAVAVLTAGVVALWALTVVFALPAAAACAVTLGAAPVVLRALPATAVSARPGMFIDFVRFQTLRWTVREPEPDPAHVVTADAARDVVTRSMALWRAGAAVVGIAVMISAPAALIPLAAAPLVRAGQIALAVCVLVALTLQSRRASDGLLRWMPRAAAFVVALALAGAATRAVAATVVPVTAGAVLAAAVAAAVLIVPVARGARSLRWSRLGDVLEALAVALALPAGLLAAGVVDLVRGMMAS